MFFETALWERRYLARALNATRLSAQFVPSPLTEQSLPKAQGAAALSVFIYSLLTRPLINRLRGGRFIPTRSTGFDHIDLKACQVRKMLVANVPAYGGSP